MRTLMDKMDEEERSKFEKGETSNWPRLQFLILESRAALLRAREASEWIVSSPIWGLGCAFVRDVIANFWMRSYLRINLG